jgi:hypothetical protein
MRPRQATGLLFALCGAAACASAAPSARDAAPIDFTVAPLMRECDALSRAGHAGTWTASPLFEAAPSMRCRLTWTSEAGAPAELGALPLAAAERASLRGASVPAPSHETGLRPRGGYAGGCDSCGVAAAGLLTLFNPYPSERIRVEITQDDGRTTALHVSAAPFEVSAFEAGVTGRVVLRAAVD